ncbi:hypothetical protein GCM10010387_62900 [Streptomyces inusitatus]|uniref:Uncharacterized protein n=1 Tax=Streptomyces inusitatus TaxID=68221 RepID=A0A918QQD1_9ACTN|nr:hypothetical protein [Streptomyces inusitatus]GGZ60643.1 hypothetical protein GCM10010387_62900 [Streptomyces inusitatus]
MEARPAGLLSGQLLRATELSPGQARSGSAMPRDQISDQELPPLVWSRQDGYLFTADPDLLRAYELVVVRQRLVGLFADYRPGRRSPGVGGTSSSRTLSP